MSNPYAVLGLSAKASKKEVKEAFRKLSLQYHPDKCTPEAQAEAAEKFRLVKEAYDQIRASRDAARHPPARDSSSQAAGRPTAPRAAAYAPNRHGAAGGTEGMEDPIFFCSSLPDDLFTRAGPDGTIQWGPYAGYRRAEGFPPDIPVWIPPRGGYSLLNPTLEQSRRFEQIISGRY